MIYRGTYHSKNFRFTTRSDGQPIDITTWQFDASLKDGTGTTVLEMSTADGHFTVTSGESGTMRWALTEAQTEALEVGPVSFALYRTDAAEGRLRLFGAIEQVRDQD